MNARLSIQYALAIAGIATGVAACNSHGQTAVLPDANINTAPAVHVTVVNDSLVQDASRLIQTGDLVMRTGTDFSSEQIKRLSTRDKTYSHGGIAVVDSDGVYIYHVEPDFYYVNDKVRREKLDSFCNPAHNLGFGIARYNLTPQEQKAFITYLDGQYRQHIPFDVQFDLSTDNRLYCSEMIIKGLAHATHNKLQITTERITDRSKFKIIKQYFKLTEKEIVTRDLVLIDHLYLNPWCSLLKQYTFLPQQ